MTGFGSPCGACKFLRRKCVRGCVFAPYFCHEQGAAHFAAIHKVFGNSNFSKLLSLLPAADRPEAAATISYEALSRLHDPVYGCVAHIFALQQQVLNLQAQLAALRAQVGGQNGGAPPADKMLDKMPQWHQGDHGGFFRTAAAPSVSASSTNCHKNSQQGVGSVEEDVSFAMAASLEMQASAWRSAYHTMDDLQSLPVAYQLRH